MIDYYGMSFHVWLGELWILIHILIHKLSLRWISFLIFLLIRASSMLISISKLKKYTYTLLKCPLWRTIFYDGITAEERCSQQLKLNDLQTVPIKVTMYKFRKKEIVLWFLRYSNVSGLVFFRQNSAMLYRSTFLKFCLTSKWRV